MIMMCVKKLFLHMAICGEFYNNPSCLSTRVISKKSLGLTEYACTR